MYGLNHALVNCSRLKVNCNENNWVGLADGRLLASAALELFYNSLLNFNLVCTIIFLSQFTCT